MLVCYSVFKGLSVNSPFDTAKILLYILAISVTIHYNLFLFVYFKIFL